jgi:hypothetical protein
MIQPKNRNMGDLLCLVVIMMIVFVLAACSGGTSSVIAEPTIERPTEPPQLSSATSFDGPLLKAGQSPVSRFIKNGIYTAAFDFANTFR